MRDQYSSLWFNNMLDKLSRKLIPSRKTDTFDMFVKLCLSPGAGKQLCAQCKRSLHCKYFYIENHFFNAIIRSIYVNISK